MILRSRENERQAKIEGGARHVKMSGKCPASELPAAGAQFRGPDGRRKGGQGGFSVSHRGPRSRRVGRSCLGSAFQASDPLLPFTQGAALGWLEGALSVLRIVFGREAGRGGVAARLGSFSTARSTEGALYASPGASPWVNGKNDRSPGRGTQAQTIFNNPVTPLRLKNSIARTPPITRCERSFHAPNA